MEVPGYKRKMKNRIIWGKLLLILTVSGLWYIIIGNFFGGRPAEGEKVI